MHAYYNFADWLTSQGPPAAPYSAQMGTIILTGYHLTTSDSESRNAAFALGTAVLVMR